MSVCIYPFICFASYFYVTARSLVAGTFRHTFSNVALVNRKNQNNWKFVVAH